MSLTAFLAQNDEAALGAQASAGLVRRAARDLAAGKAKIVSQDAEQAELCADGQTVTLSAKGLAQAGCTCPATGLCRHILLAVLALRAADPPQTAPDAPVPDPIDPRDTILGLSDSDLQSFAGAEWERACRLARTATSPDISASGTALQVSWAETSDPVTFLATGDLRAAVFKGPPSRKRASVTAAALLVRATGGTALPLASNATAQTTLTPAFLGDVEAAIRETLRAVLCGHSALAVDRLFDLSITARAEAAPRLMGSLRGLVMQAELARKRDVSFDEADFVARAGQAAALVAGLRQAPADPVLTGVLRRDYQPADPCELWFLGAEHWTGAQGARGLRVLAYAPSTGQWLETGTARGAGQDPGFTPQAAYRSPLYTLAPVARLMGQRVRLNSFKMSADNQLPWAGAGVQTGPLAPFGPTALHDHVPVHSDWSTLRADLQTRMAPGVRQAVQSVPLLLAPSHISKVQFDMLEQAQTLILTDAHEAALNVRAPETYDVARLPALAQEGQIAALLCMARLQEDGPDITPISALLNTPRPTGEWIVNLTLEALPAAKPQGPALWNKAKAFGRELVKKEPQPISPTSRSGPVPRLLNGTLTAVVAGLRTTANPQRLTAARQAEDLGLSTLAQLLADPITPDSALRIGYLCTLLRQSHGLTQVGQS